MFIILLVFTKFFELRAKVMELQHLMAGSLDLTSLESDFVRMLVLMASYPLVPYQNFPEDFVFKNVHTIA